MSRVGYESFFSDPDVHESMKCQVCGTECDAKRGVYGPTGFAAAIAGTSSRHDVFRCPHIGKEWHEAALNLVVGIAEMPSRRVAELMREDLRDLLKENDIAF